MKLPLHIAHRYLISKKSTNAINIISGISVLGITIGTAALIIVLSVFNGFDDLVKSLYNSFNPDLRITVNEGKVFVPGKNKMNALLSLDGVEAVSEVIEETALLKYGEKQFIATIKGVDDHYTKVSRVDSTIVSGRFLLKENGIHYAVLCSGIELALEANVENEFAPLSVYVPKLDNQTVLNPEDAFNRQNVYPAGTFAIQQDFDGKYVFVDLEFARELLNYTDEAGALEIRLKSFADAGKAQEEIRNIMGNDFSVKNRYEQEEVLYKVMRTEKWMVYFILTFILIIASFNMIGSLTMVVIDKKKDISILKTMGADSRLIQKIFLLEGILFSLVGSCFGFLLGTGICLAQQKFKLLKLQGMGSFVIDAYPVKMEIMDFVLVLVTVLLIGLLASWFPSRRAAEERMLFKEG